jgi:putative sterol carrier protein
MATDPPVLYLSPAWAQRAIEKVRTDPHVREAMGTHKVSVMTIVENGPPDRLRVLYASFDGEGNSDLRVGTDVEAMKSAVPEPTFTIRGDYATFAALRDGKVTEKQAFMHRQLHITGHKFRALVLAHALQSLTHALSQVECVT